MVQSIPRMPRPPGICHFVLGKLQMPHGGGRAVHTKPRCGAKIKAANALPRGNTKTAFSSHQATNAIL